MATLAGQATLSRLREESQGRIDSYLILAAPQSSLEESKDLTAKMEAAGFDDFHIFWRGLHKGRVSLGVYVNKVYAEERMTLLQGLGFESELVPRNQKPTHYWLDVELLPQTTALDFTAAETPGKTELAASPCRTVDDDEQPRQTLARTLTPG